MKNEQTLYFATLFFGALKVADKGIVGRNKNVGVHIVFYCHPCHSDKSRGKAKQGRKLYVLLPTLFVLFATFGGVSLV